MGGGAGPAGQVLAGPLFCLINEQILFIRPYQFDILFHE